LLHAVARDRAVGRSEVRFGGLVGDPLEDDGRLGEDFAAVGFERGDVTLGVDREVVLAAARALRAKVDAVELERKTRFAERDVRRERACASCVIELRHAWHACESQAAMKKNANLTKAMKLAESGASPFKIVGYTRKLAAVDQVAVFETLAKRSSEASDFLAK